MNKRIIVYGLGWEFILLKELLEGNYRVVGYSDKRVMYIEKYIAPSEISQHDYDAIFITSNMYFDEIKEGLENALGETLFLTKKDMLGTSCNSLERDKWVIAKLSEIEKGKTLLDARAGEMKYSQYCSHLNI